MTRSEEYWNNAKRCSDRADKCEMARMKVYWEDMVRRWTQYAEEAEVREQRELREHGYQTPPG